MKKLITIAFFILICFSGKAQITFDDLLKIQRSDVGDISAFLIDRNWQLVNSEEETADSYGSMRWAYSVGEYESEKAEMWLSMEYSSEYENRVSLQIHNKVVYSTIKAKILSYGMKKIASGLQDGFTYTDFMGKNYVARIAITSNSESRGGVYHILVWNKRDYLSKYTDADDETI